METIDLTTGGLEGHFVIRGLLQRAAASLDVASVLSYQTEELEELVKREIHKLWHLPPGHIVLTSSGTEAVSFSLTILANSSKPLLVQNPSYFGAWRSLRGSTPTIWDGASSSSLLYVCPNLHPANGASIPEKQLVDYAGPLILDDPYFPLTEKKHHLAQLRSQARDVVIGSFAKLVGPGTRCGFIWTRNKSVFKQLRSLKITQNLGISPLLLELILSADLSRHIAEIREYNSSRQRLASTYLNTQDWAYAGVFRFFRVFPDYYERLLRAGIKVDRLDYYYQNTQPPLFRINLFRHDSILLTRALSVLRDLKVVEEISQIEGTVYIESTAA